MSETPNFGIPLITPGSDNPEVAANDGFTKVDGVLKTLDDRLTDVEEDEGSGLPPGGTEGQYLKKTSTGAAWGDPPNGGGGGGSGVPAGGTTGQVLTKNSSADGDASWKTLPASGGGGGGGSLFSPPLAADFPTRDEFLGAITLVDDPDVGLIVSVLPKAGDIPSGVFKNLPASGDWEVTARFVPHTVHIDFHSLGFSLYNSANGGYHNIIGLDMAAAALKIQHNKYRRLAGGGYQGGVFSAGTYANPNPFIRIKYTQSNGRYTVYMSPNGKAWRKVAHFVDGDNGGGGKFDKVGLGFGCNYGNGGDAEIFDAFSVPYWQQSW